MTTNFNSPLALGPNLDFLNASDVREFWNENGYYHAKNVFSPEEVALLETDFNRIVGQLLSSGEHINARWRGEEMARLDGGNSVIFHTHNVQAFSPVWMRALMHPNFLAAATALLGEDVMLHHTKLFQKPAENGAPFPMHQDWTYFPSLQDSMLAGVIHVSDATDEMGCLRVFPGSHKLGRIDGSSGQSYNETLAQYPIEEALAVEAQAGDVVFFHYFTLHGSLPNRSNATRKTVLAQLYSGQDEMESGVGHTVAGLALNGWNSAMTREKAGKL